MFRNSSPPIVPRRGDAPTTATERGSKNGASDAATATWSRRSRRSSSAGRRPELEHDLDDAGLDVRARLEAGVVEHAQHRAVLRQHVGDELFDSDGGRVRGEPLEQARPDAAPVQVVGDGERDLGARRIVQADVRRERDRPQRPSPRRARRGASRACASRSRVRRPPSGDRSRRAVEAEVAALGGERLEELDQRLVVRLRSGRAAAASSRRGARRLRRPAWSCQAVEVMRRLCSIRPPQSRRSTVHRLRETTTTTPGAAPIRARRGRPTLQVPEQGGVHRETDSSRHRRLALGGEAQRETIELARALGTSVVAVG